MNKARDILRGVINAQIAKGSPVIVEKPMPANRFTAYKVRKPSNERTDFVRRLTLEQARNEKNFPLGLQHDERGAFVWTYGINDGEKI